jgi:DNA-binding PadR family transcriptional regulator
MSAAETTRLLVLGVTVIFEPANGYQLRRELLSWDVESWANIQPGSIYSMLATLTKQGLVERFDLVTSEGARPVAVYQSTEAGRAELRELVKQGILQVNQFDQGLAYAALSIMVMVFTRAEVLPLLERRQLALADGIVQLREKSAVVAPDSGTPPHVARLMGYAIQMHEAELDWLKAFTENVRSGDLVFLGEPEMSDWQPAADDPAWRMVDEREVYLAAIATMRH